MIQYILNDTEINKKLAELQKIDINAIVDLKNRYSNIPNEYLEFLK